MSMSINEDEKKKIMKTKSPLLTMKVLRPLANLIAEYTSPSQINSIAKDFGFEEKAKTPDDVSGALLRMFHTLLEENNYNDITKIIETLLTLYAHLIDEKLHEKGLIGSVREILHRGHFNLAFNTIKKEYIIKPFDLSLHKIIMKVEGTSKEDFLDIEKHQMRVESKKYSEVINYVDLSLSNGLKIGLATIKITKTQYPLIESLIKAGISKEDDKCITYNPFETTKLRNSRADASFRSLLKEIRKKSKIKGKELFKISPVKNGKGKNSYCFIVYKI